MGAQIASSTRMNRAYIFPSILVVTAIAVTLGIVLYSWQNMGVEISGHGMLAFGLGSVATLALSAGLFFLLFMSARKGFDETGQQPEDPFNR